MNLKKTGKFKVYHLAFLSPITWLTLASTPGFAQNITASEDGTGTQISQQGDEFQISGGTENGGNQFHSFEQFGLEEQQTATFQTNPDTANVLGRVTGGDPSVINGTVRVTGSEANLYLMNPAGMVFGENARLDVPGSFHGTTADAIEFEEGEFSATGNNAYENLAGAPNRFQFEGGSTGTIVNQGDLAVGSGKNLSLTGSTVINTGTLTAPGGQVAVVAAPTAQGSQSVRITQNGMVMGLEVAGDRLSEANLSPQDLIQNPTHLPKVLTGGYVDHATDLQVVDGRVYLRGSALAIDPLTGAAVVSGVVNVSSPDPLTQGGAVLVQGDRVQVLDAQMAAQGHGGQIHLQSHQATQVLSSQLTLGNLVGIGGLLKIQGASVGVEDTTIAAPGLQRGGLIQIHALEGLAHLGNSSITAIARQGTGGRVEVLGDRVAVVATAIDASGVAGGKLYIGGDYQGGGTLATAQEVLVDGGSVLKAEGLGWHPADTSPPPPDLPQALGGQVIVWADNRTRFYGVLKAKGAAEFSDSGFAEISGKTVLDLGTGWFNRITTGELLLDPTNITIQGGSLGTIGSNPPGANLLGATDISNFLATGSLTLTTSSGGTDAGVIRVAGGAVIRWSSAYDLTLQAHDSIMLNAGSEVTSTGHGSILFDAPKVYIGYGEAFGNGSFESADLGIMAETLDSASGVQGSIPGWRVFAQQVRLGTTEIGGFVGPGDPGASYGQSLGDNYTYVGSFRGEIVNDHAGGEGNTRSIQLGSAGNSQSRFANFGDCNVGYCTIHGPYLISDSTSYLAPGYSVSFDWRAIAGGDDYDVHGYLLNPVTGATVELLDARGQATDWQRCTTVLSESAAAGNYQFVFVGGSYDASGGKALGADFRLDRITTTPPAGDTYTIEAHNIRLINTTGSPSSPWSDVYLGTDVTLQSHGTLQSNGGTLALGNVHGSDYSLTLATSGTTLLQGAVQVERLVTDGTGGLQLAGSVTTAAPLSLGEAVTLIGDATLTTGNQPLTLTGSVSGPNQTLTLNTTGTTTLAAGGTLHRLITDGPGILEIAGNLSTQGTLTLGEEVRLMGDTTIATETGDLTFHNRVDGQRSLWNLTLVSAGGTVGLHRSVGADGAGSHGGIQNLTVISNTITFPEAGASITGRGILTIAPHDVATSMGLGDRVPGTLNLTAAELNSINRNASQGFSRIDLSRSDSRGSVRIGQGIDPSVTPLMNLLGGQDLGVGDQDGNQWGLTGLQSGTVNGVRFQNFTTLLGGALGDRLQGTSASDYFRVIGPDTITLGSMTFSNVKTIAAGAGDDTFQFGTAGSLAGTIDGGLGSDWLIADDGGALIDISGTNAGTYAEKVANWRNIENIQGGTGNDTFLLSANTLTGTLDGGGGLDTMVGDTVPNRFVILIPNGGTVTGVLGGFRNIENLTGNRFNDTFLMASTGSLTGLIDGGEGLDVIQSATSPITVIIDGENAGTFLSLIDRFARIENLIGGPGNDTFIVDNGTLTGSIDGGLGIDQLLGGYLENRNLESIVPGVNGVLFRNLLDLSTREEIVLALSLGEAAINEAAVDSAAQDGATIFAAAPSTPGATAATNEEPEAAATSDQRSDQGSEGENAGVASAEGSGAAAGANGGSSATGADGGGAGAGGAGAGNGGAGGGAGAGGAGAGNGGAGAGNGGAANVPDPTTANGSNGSNGSNAPDPTTARGGAGKGPGGSGADGAPDPIAVASGGGAGGGAAAGADHSGQGLAIAATVVAGLAAVGGTAAAIATGAAQSLVARLQGLVSGGGAAGGAGAAGAGSLGASGLSLAAVASLSQAQQQLAQLQVALEPQIATPLHISLNKSEGTSLTGEAMELADQALWTGTEPDGAIDSLPGLGELLGVESGRPAIAATEPDAQPNPAPTPGHKETHGDRETPAPHPAAPDMQHNLETKVAAVKAKIAAAAAQAGIPEGAVDALYAVAIERIGEILSSIDLAEGILGTAWSKALEIMEYRALVEHIQAQGTLMIPLVTHEILAEQTPSIELKFQETPVGNFEINLSLGVIVHGATLALEGGKLTHIHLGRISLTGGIEFAGLSLFEAPDAELEINRIIPLGDGITIPLPT